MQIPTVKLGSLKRKISSGRHTGALKAREISFSQLKRPTLRLGALVLSMVVRRRFLSPSPFPGGAAMAVQWRVVKALGTGVGIFVGALLVFQVWPSDEVRSAKISKEFRESSKSYLDSQRQNALIMEVLKEAATTDENWARKSFSSKK